MHQHYLENEVVNNYLLTIAEWSSKFDNCSIVYKFTTVNDYKKIFKWYLKKKMTSCLREAVTLFVLIIYKQALLRL